MDAAGNVLVTGWTGWPGWTSGGFDTSYNGYGDAFAAKLSPSGAHLWSTYLGGGSEDYGYGIAVDAAGNVLVTGWTASAGWTSGGFDTSYNGGSTDAYVVKLSSSGAHLWSTYLGGSDDDRGGGIAVGAAGNVLVTGWTASAGWTSGGFDTSYNGGSYDAFVAQIYDGPVARYVFHNNSDWDGNNAAANADDDAAIDTSKTPALPGGASSISCVVTNRKGINGVMLDIQNIGGTVTAADFTIKRSGVGNGSAAVHYSAAAGPTSVLQRAGAGVGGSTRVHLIFPDGDGNTPTDDNSRWMRIEVAANANTGLAAADVFYIGLSVGESDCVDYKVNTGDRLNARNDTHTFLNPAPVDCPTDYNRDKRGDTGDRLIQRNHLTTFMNDIAVIGSFPP